MLLYDTGSFDDIRLISFESSNALLESIFDFNGHTNEKETKTSFNLKKCHVLPFISQNKLNNSVLTF